MNFEETIIENSKVKILLLTIVSFIFVAIGAWIVAVEMDFTIIIQSFDNFTFGAGLGIVSIAFFSLCGFWGLRKFFSSTPGLVLNQKGIYDNSSAASIGFIPWTEVIGIEQSQIQRQKFISIYLKNPNHYLSKGNLIQRLLNKSNFKLCGTPINISSNSLQISFAELFTLINQHYNNANA